MLRAGIRYAGKVIEGSRLFQSNTKKTTGFQVNVELEDDMGFTEKSEHVIWLTPKNKDRALRDFETLGVTEEQLRNAAFVQYELPQVIVGREFVCETKAEEYGGQQRVKVAWIAPRGASNEQELVGGVVAMFGGKAPDDQDDIPF